MALDAARERALPSANQNLAPQTSARASAATDNLGAAWCARVQCSVGAPLEAISCRMRLPPLRAGA